MTDVEITGTAQREAWLAKELPATEQVRDGLWSIPVPIPIPSLRYVLAYALELADGVAVVDPGWDTPEAYAGLETGLSEAGFAMADVRAILITHAHPDHIGLAARVQQESGAWVGTHPIEAATVPTGPEQIDALVAGTLEGLVEAGADRAEAENLTESSARMRQLMDIARPNVLIGDGARVELPGWELDAVWTPGHTPGHLCFVDRRNGVVLTGDHVLPRISPNISVHLLNPAEALSDYLASLHKIAEAAAPDAEVLPAHEYRFRGLVDRVAALTTHHEERLAEILDLLGRSESGTAWFLSERLTWSRPWDQIQVQMRRAAVGETIAHLELLKTRGQVVSVAGDVRRWSVTVR